MPSEPAHSVASAVPTFEWVVPGALLEGLGPPQAPPVLPGVLSKMPRCWQRPCEREEADKQLAREGHVDPSPERSCNAC